MQVGTVVGEGHGDDVKQAGAVGGADREDVVCALFVRFDADHRQDREMLDLARGTHVDRRFRWRFPRQTVAEFVFDELDETAVVVTAADVEQDEAVQRVTVARGVNLGVHDVETGAAEKSHHAGKQIAGVVGIGHHLDAVTMRADAGLDDRPGAVGAVEQCIGVPGDFFCRVAQEVNRVELVP